MRKWLFGGFLGVVLFASAHAEAACTYTYSFTSGTTAVASQVNQDLNDIVNCALPASGGTLTGGTLSGTTTLPGSGVITSAGNIGLGTTTPARPLSISASANDVFSVQIANTAAGGNSWTLISSATGSGNPAGSLGFFNETGGSTKMYLQSNGNLVVNGSGTTCTIGSGTGATNCTSDERLKTNIAAISGADALAGLAKISGVTFNWTDPSRPQNQQIGVIAQEVQKAFPQLVDTTTTDFMGQPGPYLSVAHAALVSPLISGINQVNGVYHASHATTSTPTLESYFEGSATSTPSIFVDAAGNVGLGTTAPSYTLHVNGSVAGTSAYSNLSDARLTNDVTEITGSLALIGKLRGVRFHWREPEERQIGKSIDLPVDEPQVGFIAQEVEPVVPEAVTQTKDGIRNIRESKIVPLLVEAVKEQQAQIAELTAAVRTLKAANDNLQQKVAAIRNNGSGENARRAAQ